jgi:hypothetical protein
MLASRGPKALKHAGAWSTRRRRRTMSADATTGRGRRRASQVEIGKPDKELVIEPVELPAEPIVAPAQPATPDVAEPEPAPA